MWQACMYDEWESPELGAYGKTVCAMLHPLRPDGAVRTSTLPQVD